MSKTYFTRYHQLSFVLSKHNLQHSSRQHWEIGWSLTRLEVSAVTNSLCDHPGWCRWVATNFTTCMAPSGSEEVRRPGILSISFTASRKSLPSCGVNQSWRRRWIFGFEPTRSSSNGILASDYFHYLETDMTLLKCKPRCFKWHFLPSTAQGWIRRGC